MYDFQAKILNFHDKHINLTREQQNDMKRRRDTNSGRIINGLQDLDKPLPIGWINQGGYAQRTMTQPPEGDEASCYDIDLGLVYLEDDTKTPQTTKNWVKDALKLKATNVKNDPDAKKNCVRIVYADGYQCDFPVFKKGLSDEYFLASGNDWITSNPKSMNDWIEERNATLSPDSSSPRQLRKIIRMIKYFCKVHSFKSNLKFPAGLVATAIAIECYAPVGGRDDESFYRTLKKISNRYAEQPVFANGVQISDQDKDIPRIQRMIDSATSACEALSQLDSDDNVSEHDAFDAWEKVFKHSYFEVETQTAKGSMESKSALVGGAVGALATSAIASSDKLSQAEKAVSEINSSGRSTGSWGSS